MRINAIIISLFGISILLALFFVLPAKEMTNSDISHLKSNEKVVINGKIMKISESNRNNYRILLDSNFSVYFKSRENIYPLLNKNVKVIAITNKFDNVTQLIAYKVQLLH